MAIPNWETLEASGIMIGAVSLIIIGGILLYFGNKYLGDVCLSLIHV